MITRRRVILAVLALFLVGAGTVAWTLAGLPPIKYYLRYGLDPYCEPTGERVTYEGVEFVEIGPGIFRMGSTYLAEGDDDSSLLGRICAFLGLPWGRPPTVSNEMPVHWVEFRRGFWIATTEVTNAQFERFRPKKGRSQHSNGDDTPVVDVPWEDAKAYCAWIAKSTGRPIRLPSEAEWECACRAGSGGKYSLDSDGGRLSDCAWFGYGRVRDGHVHAVATKKPNRWGLYDLHGNVSEWCEDAYHVLYEGAPSDGSAWLEGGELWAPGVPWRVLRGGSWLCEARQCRSAARVAYRPDFPLWYLGFRPAFSNPE